MIEKNIKSKIVQKHDVEINWNNKENYIPDAGLLIIYDPDQNYPYSRFKIGDGVNNIQTLSFINLLADWNQTDANKIDYIKNKPILGSLASKELIEKTDLSEEVQNSLNNILWKQF